MITPILEVKKPRPRGLRLLVQGPISKRWSRMQTWAARVAV